MTLVDVLRHVEEGPFDNEGFRCLKSLKEGDYKDVVCSLSF